MKRNGFNSDKNLIIFFAITFLWTWVFGFLPVILGLTETTIGTILFYFGGGAPSVVALFMVFITFSKRQRRDFFSRCFNLKRMGIKWPLLTVLFFVAIAFVGVSISVGILGYEAPGMSWLNIGAKQPYLIPVFLLLSLVSGPLNEEFGWRGYSLDRLFVRFGFVRASLIMGFIWAIWHAAWYFTPGQVQYDLLQTSLFDAFMFVPSTMLLSVIISFVYIHTKRSVFAGAFVHMMCNFFTSQLLAPCGSNIATAMNWELCITGAALAVYCGLSKDFKRIFAGEMESFKKMAEPEV